MTWLFSPIKSMETNPGVLADNRTLKWKAWTNAVAVVTGLFRESPFRESVLSYVF